MTDSLGRRVKRLAVEGNIAAGKSSFLRILEYAHLDYVVVQEPINKWQRVEDPADEDFAPSASQETGGNLLELFYSDPQRYAYTFQSYAFLSRMRAQMQPFSDFEDQLKRGPPRETGGSATSSSSSSSDSDRSPREGLYLESSSSDGEADSAAAAAAAAAAAGGKRKFGETASSSSKSLSAGQPPQKVHRAEELSPVVQFFERSVYSDRYCFAHNCWAQGLFTDLEWGIYRDWHHWLTHAFPQLRIDGIIYLRTKPETCAARLKKRDRAEESTVSLEYLDSIHTRHEDWLINKQTNVSELIRDVPILVLDCDQEFESEPIRRGEMLKQIAEFAEKV